MKFFTITAKSAALTIAIALGVASVTYAPEAEARRMVQCSGSAALIYYYNSDGSVHHTEWVSEHPDCV